MWNEQEGGGGFGTPGGGLSQTPGGSEKRRQRAQNLVPVMIRDILECGEETLSVEGREVGMVSIVGSVLSVTNEATKSVYGIQDESGKVDVIQWLDEGQDGCKDNISEDMHCRVIGSVRTSQGKKHIMAFKLTALDSRDEIRGHALEVAYAKLKLRQLKDKENSTIGANPLSNSIVVGGNSAYSSSASGTGNTFSNPKHEGTFKMISGCMREEGISRDELLSSLGKKMSRNDLNDALYFLSGEGHIYSTIDEDHFKTTDS